MHEFIFINCLKAINYDNTIFYIAKYKILKQSLVPKIFLGARAGR